MTQPISAWDLLDESRYHANERHRVEAQKARRATPYSQAVLAEQNHEIPANPVGWVLH